MMRLKILLVISGLSFFTAVWAQSPSKLQLTVEVAAPNLVFTIHNEGDVAIKLLSPCQPGGIRKEPLLTSVVMKDKQGVVLKQNASGGEPNERLMLGSKMSTPIKTPDITPAIDLAPKAKIVCEYSIDLFKYYIQDVFSLYSKQRLIENEIYQIQFFMTIRQVGVEQHTSDTELSSAPISLSLK